MIHIGSDQFQFEMIQVYREKTNLRPIIRVSSKRPCSDHCG